MFYLVVGAIAAYALYQTFFADNNRDECPPGRSQSVGTAQPVRRRDERQQRQTIDSSQVDYTPLEASAILRARANQEGELMAQCYQQSQEAYRRRDRARAKALSELGRRHMLEMEQLNAKASAAIFKENNQVRCHNGCRTCAARFFQNKAAGEVDLHGLYVKEAISYSEKAIAEARRRGASDVRLIVGQGTHSDGGVARLKPAIQEDMQMRGIYVEVHPKNPGVLIVQLGGR